jgi:hypothetical protein
LVVASLMLCCSGRPGLGRNEWSCALLFTQCTGAKKLDLPIVKLHQLLLLVGGGTLSTQCKVAIF